MFNILNNLSPEILTEIFEKRANPYNFWGNNTFRTRQVNSRYHGTRSSSILRPKIWGMMSW